jgi:50S ribosomal subunit-associated GTPase HflX
VFYVADGTRRETFEQLFSLQDLARSAAGDVPSIVAFNKYDLKDQWLVSSDDAAKLIKGGFRMMTTSAKTGEGVEEAFRILATATLSSAVTQTVQPPARHGN